MTDGNQPKEKLDVKNPPNQNQENLTVAELKYICEVFFNDKPHEMISRIAIKRNRAKDENNVKLLELLDKDLYTIRTNWHAFGGSTMIVKIDGKEYKLTGKAKL